MNSTNSMGPLQPCKTLDDFIIISPAIRDAVFAEIPKAKSDVLTVQED